MTTSLEAAIAQLLEVVDPADLSTALSALEGPRTKGVTSGWLTPEADRAWRRVLSAWRASWPEAPLGLLAQLVRSAAAAAERASRSAPKVDVVWTGPRTLVPVRLTERVVDELIEGSRDDLLLISYVVHTVPRLIKRLAAAMERGVRVSMLFERGSWYGGSLGFDAARSIREALPGVRMLSWADPEGSVHVKALVADDSSALVTSANLTGAALHRNMELGVLIKGGAAPKRIREHFDRLLADGVLVEIRR